MDALAGIGAVLGIMFMATAAVLWASWYHEMLQYVPPEFKDHGKRGAVSAFLDDPKVPQSPRDRYHWQQVFGMTAIFLGFAVSFYYQNYRTDVDLVAVMDAKWLKAANICTHRFSSQCSFR